jgi:hypothetical protein
LLVVVVVVVVVVVDDDDDDDDDDDEEEEEEVADNETCSTLLDKPGNATFNTFELALTILMVLLLVL